MMGRVEMGCRHVCGLSPTQGSRCLAPADILPALCWGLGDPHPSVSSGLPCAPPSPSCLIAPSLSPHFFCLESFFDLPGSAHDSPGSPVAGAVAQFGHTLHTAVPASWLICFSNCPGGWESFTTLNPHRKQALRQLSWLLLELMDRWTKWRWTYGGPDRLCKSCR